MRHTDAATSQFFDWLSDFERYARSAGDAVDLPVRLLRSLFRRGWGVEHAYVFARYQLEQPVLN